MRLEHGAMNIWNVMVSRTKNLHAIGTHGLLLVVRTNTKSTQELYLISKPQALKTIA